MSRNMPREKSLKDIGLLRLKITKKKKGTDILAVFKNIKHCWEEKGSNLFSISTVDRNNGLQLQQDTFRVDSKETLHNNKDDEVLPV